MIFFYDVKKGESTFFYSQIRDEREGGGGEIFFSSFDVKIKFLSIKKGHEFFVAKIKRGRMRGK